MSEATIVNVLAGSFADSFDFSNLSVGFKRVSVFGRMLEVTISRVANKVIVTNDCLLLNIDFRLEPDELKDMLGVPAEADFPIKSLRVTISPEGVVYTLFVFEAASGLTPDVYVSNGDNYFKYLKKRGSFVVDLLASLGAGIGREETFLNDHFAAQRQPESQSFDDIHMWKSWLSTQYVDPRHRKERTEEHHELVGRFSWKGAKITVYRAYDEKSAGCWEFSDGEHVSQEDILDAMYILFLPMGSCAVSGSMQYNSKVAINEMLKNGRSFSRLDLVKYVSLCGIRKADFAIQITSAIPEVRAMIRKYEQAFDVLGMEESGNGLIQKVSVLAEAIQADQNEKRIARINRVASLVSFVALVSSLTSIVVFMNASDPIVFSEARIIVVVLIAALSGLSVLFFLGRR